LPTVTTSIYPADESPDGQKPIWKFGFTLELKQREGAHRSYHGTGFDSGLGFVAFLDTLPETLTFVVKQKQYGADDTNDAIITDTIEFKRASFNMSSNRAMQRTAGRSPFSLSMTSTLNVQRRAPSPAVADLVSR
jgi:hypothetical protein